LHVAQWEIISHETFRITLLRNWRKNAITKQKTGLNGKFNPPPSKKWKIKKHVILFVVDSGPSDTTVVFPCICGIYICMFLALEGGFACLNTPQNFAFFCFPTAPQLHFKIWGQLPTSFRSFLFISLWVIYIECVWW
jgi:hypothetical protein